MKKSLILLSMPLLLFGCSRDAAQIGSIPVSQKDLDYRVKVSGIYYPGSGKRYVALSQLIKGYLSSEILQAHGHAVDDAVLEREAKRIDESTKAPESLAKIKAVYGSDRNAYLRTFVRVTYAERVLYGEIFLKSRDIHREQYLKEEDLLRGSTVSPGKFATQAKAAGIPVSMLKLSRESGIEPYEKRKGAPQPAGFAGLEQAGRIIPLLYGIKPGDVCSEVIELQKSYQIIRFLKREGRSYIVESVSIPKKSYDEWFWSEAAKIPVRIRGKALKQELMNEVSWAKNLRLE